MSVAMAMGAMAMASMSGSASGASVAAACTLPGVNGQPSCTEGCQPFAHVELVGGHPNVTIDDSSNTFICPDGGCNIDSSCSTTAPENKCEAGWVMGRPFSTQDGHVVSKLIQRKASGWAEDLPAETGRATSDNHFCPSLITQIGLLGVHFRPSFEEIYMEHSASVCELRSSFKCTTPFTRLLVYSIHESSKNPGNSNKIHRELPAATAVCTRGSLLFTR